MSAPDPEGFSMLTKVIATATAVITPVVGLYKWADFRLDKKADKDAVQASFTALKDELTAQRGDITRIFDKIGEGEKVNEKRHRELMMHLLERR